jgi:lysozyme family protein
MVASTYDAALRRLLAHEGGYVNHPSDPGGPTNFGITLADYRRYVKPGATAADVKTMKLAEAAQIYRAKYWGAMRCDELPAGVDYCVFDYCVNSGTGRVPKVLQRLTGSSVTGRMDDALVRAVKARDPRTMVAAVCDERMRFLQGLKTWPTFGKGWARRVREVRAAASALAQPAIQSPPPPAPMPAPATPAPGKGEVPVNAAAQKGSAGGAAASGGVVAQQSAEAGADPVTVVTIIVVTALLAVGAWAFWRWRQKRRQEAETPETTVVPEARGG